MQTSWNILLPGSNHSSPVGQQPSAIISMNIFRSSNVNRDDGDNPNILVMATCMHQHDRSPAPNHGDVTSPKDIAGSLMVKRTSTQVIWIVVTGEPKEQEWTNGALFQTSTAWRICQIRTTQDVSLGSDHSQLKPIQISLIIISTWALI